MKIYTHISDFKAMFRTIQRHGASFESVWVAPFHLTLKDRAKNRRITLRPESIHAWPKTQTQFLRKFFPLHKTIIRISSFTIQEGETFYQCWDRTMEAIKALPTSWLRGLGHCELYL